MKQNHHCSGIQVEVTANANNIDNTFYANYKVIYRKVLKLFFKKSFYEYKK